MIGQPVRAQDTTPPSPPNPLTSKDFKTGKMLSITEICGGLDQFLQPLDLSGLTKKKFSFTGDEQPDTRYPVLIFTENNPLPPPALKGTDDKNKGNERNRRGGKKARDGNNAPRAAGDKENAKNDIPAKPPPASDPALYWKPGHRSMGGRAFVRLDPKSFTPISYTTEPLIVLTCNAGPGSPDNPTDEQSTISVPDDTRSEGVMQAEKANADLVQSQPPQKPKTLEELKAQIKKDKEQIRTIEGKRRAADKAAGDTPAESRYTPTEQFDLVLLDSVADNSMTYIYFHKSGAVESNNTKPGAAAPKVMTASKASTDTTTAGPGGSGGSKGNTKKKTQDTDGTKADTTTDTTPVIAWAIIERHKVVHYSIGGGFVVFRATQQTYAVNAVQSTTSTQNCVGKLLTSLTGATGPMGPPQNADGTPGYAFDPCSGAIPTITGAPTGTTVSSYESNVTNGSVSGTTSYIFGTKGQPWQIDAVPGLTVYPFGHDTYYPSIGRGFDPLYGIEHPWNSLGIFLGTSVNTFGNFTPALTYEVFPGVQIMAGATIWQRNKLASNLIPCSGYNQSPLFAIQPTTTEDDTAVSFTPSSTTNGVTTPSMNTVTDTKTKVSTSLVSGCANGNIATIFSGTTPPTQQVYNPAFSFGFLFNTNLSKAFSGVFK
jgi:hypothetical protein